MSWEPYVGRRVVCINDNWEWRVPGVTYPAQDAVYTVRGSEGACDSQDPATCAQAPYIWLTQIINPTVVCADGLFEPSFSHEAFRPVLERETDISALTALLNPSLGDVGEFIVREALGVK